jgi:hypothetical protein
MDDFAWLSLHLEVRDVQSFFSALFRPLAQGTIRPWSERLFFIAGWHLFGMEAAPYRAVAFATMFANLWLLGSVARKLTGSPLAAFSAPLLWVCNGNLYTPMSWTSAYNQILCATFLLSALLLWIRYTETGERRWYLLQWIVFVLGFGALEVNLVFPALAALHALCFARPYLRHTLPMFAVSAVYVAVHRWSAPPPQSDVYRMYFDAGLLEGIATFFAWSIGAHRYASFRGPELWPFILCAVVAGVALMVAAIRNARLALFCVGWFLVVLAPVLPLKNHRSDYYLTIPVAGLAILAASGIARSHGLVRVAALGAALAYALPGAWMAHGMSDVFRGHSTRVKHLVRGVAGAAKQHPGTALLVSGVDSTLFWRGWYDPVFRALHIPSVYLTGDSREALKTTDRGSDVERFFVADTIALPLLQQRQARVYEVMRDGRLREITAVYQARLERSDLAGPSYLDVRLPVYAPHIGSGWWPAETNHRWMSERASVQLRGPAKAPGTLIVRGWCTPRQVPLQLTVSVDGAALPPASVDAGNLQFELRFPLPVQSTGKRLMNIEVRTDRTLLLPGDGRALGPAFGTFQVVP